MKILNSLLPFSFCTFLLVGAGAATLSTTDRVPAGDRSSPLASEAPESALKWAMSGEAVRQVMGQPDEIRPMKAPQGKAEIWIFTRELNQRVERLPVGSMPIMTTVYEIIGSCHDKKVGQTRDQRIGETIVYGDLRLSTVETVELLMFNGHFVTHKVSRQEVRRYN